MEPPPEGSDRLSRRPVLPVFDQGALMKRTLVLAVLALSALPLRAEEPVDLSMMPRIRDEGLHNSQVMDTLFQLTDVIGPRLTGSPQAKQANEWTRDQFTRWGLVNAHLE